MGAVFEMENYSCDLFKMWIKNGWKYNSSLENFSKAEILQNNYQISTEGQVAFANCVDRNLLIQSLSEVTLVEALERIAYTHFKIWGDELAQNLAENLDRMIESATLCVNGFNLVAVSLENPFSSDEADGIEDLEEGVLKIYSTDEGAVSKIVELSVEGEGRFKSQTSVNVFVRFDPASPRDRV